MPRSVTRYLDFQTLEAKGASAVVVIKLMMACNDMAVANQALGDWKEAKALGDKSIRPGGGMYFVRVEIAHLFEAFQIVQQIKEDPVLMTVVNVCDHRTRESFAKLETYLPGAGNHANFKQLVELVRHNVTFHYQSDKLIDRVIKDRAGRAEVRTSSITRGDNVRLWHFQVADDVVDSVVVRHLWKVPAGTDVRAGADAAADRIHEFFLSFMDFAGDFIWRYCEK